MATVGKNKFYGGLADDVRQESVIHASNISHFDIWSNPYRLTPNRVMSAADATSGSNIRNFLFASDSLMYAIGVNPAASTKMRLFSSDYLAFSSWTTVATSATETIPTPSEFDGRNAFIEYKKILYGVHGANLTQLWSYNLSTLTYNETAQTFVNNYTRCGGAIIGDDDNLYIALSNTTTPRNDLIKIDSSGADSIAPLVLPSNEVITSLTKFKSFLAIGTLVNGTETTVGVSSKIYLWDYVSQEPSQIILCPKGAIYGLANVEGDLIAIFRTFRIVGVATNSTVISIWDGQRMRPLKTIIRVTPTLSRYQVHDGQLFFAGQSNGSGSSYDKTGIYAVGRTAGAYDWSVCMKYQVTASGNTTNPSAVNGFYIVDDVLWASHDTDNVTKIVNDATYSNTSIYETLKNDLMPFGDRPKKKTLTGVAVTYAPLGSSAQVMVKYRVDEETNYTTLFTETTDNAVVTESKNTSTLPSGWREIQFRIESTGGAEITGFYYSYDTEKSLIF